jgi:hypothetical protein
MRTTVSVLLALLWFTAVCPRASSAMDIKMFDDMAVQDQKDYLKYLVKHAEKVLIELGQRDEAAKLKELFQKIPPGEHRSAGEARLEENLARIRSYVRPPSDMNFVRTMGGMEGQLIQTMSMKGLKTTGEFGRTLDQRTREKPFWPKLPLRTN